MDPGDEDLYEVVISGISGKFPLSDDIEQFKENLMAQKNLVTEENCRWNRDKWKVPSATGKISVVNKFDDTFFGIFSGVAAMMDPLTRVTIERAYEAVMDAGVNPKKLRGGMTAVYTASSTSDSEAVGCDEKLTAKFWLLAHVRALLANRISYAMNLQGPSWTIDSTWIGGIECLTRAVNDIRKGRVDSALVGVTNVILFPDMFHHWMGLKKLSPDGNCLPFAEDANGYARSESVVFLFLQRECEASRIYAKVTEADAMFCGDKAETFLKPKEEAFIEFLRSFYNHKNTISKPISYVEADGSADKYLDEIELNSIGQVLCDEKNNRNLLIGSVKGNVGHAEAASPFVSLTKALISMDSDVIPPNRCSVNPNKRIKKLHTKEMELPVTPTPFPEGKYAAVNAIGLCPSIGHVVLEQFPKKKKQPATDKPIPRLVVVSARHEAGLLQIINKLESMPHDDEYFTMVNEIFRDSMTGHFFRGYAILGATEKKIHFTLETDTPIKRPIWFVFAGMGSQWPGMGADLMGVPVFAQTIHELNSYVTPLGIDLINVVTNYDPTVLQNVVNAFVGIVAVQIGLVEILKQFGIEPDGYFGHSLGENMCAYVDGCFNKYQTIMAAYYRGKASSEIAVAKGLMAAVGLNYKQLTNLPPSVQIACHNADDSTTISGPFDDVSAYIEQLKEQKIFVRAVNSNYVAYHSNQVKPLAPIVLANIRKIVPNPKRRSKKWISTSRLESEWDLPEAQFSSADYHVYNFTNPVFFAEACKYVPENAAVIEISPHGLFQGILKRMLHESCFVIPLGKRETSNSLNFLLSSIGKLYVVGLQPNINNIYPAVEYPVSRGTPSLANLATWNHDMDWEINIYHSEVTIKPMEINLRKQEWRFLSNYVINEKVVMPFTTLLVETMKAYETKDPILVFDNILIPKYTEISATETTTIYTQLQMGSGNFEITENNRILLSGNLHYSQDSFCSADLDDVEYDEDSNYIFSRREIENVLERHSIHVYPQMRDIEKIIFTETGCCAHVIWNGKLDQFIHTISAVKIFWDLCLTNKGPILTSKFSKFSIETEEYFTKNPGSVIKLNYDKRSNVFAGPGVQMIGLENSYYAGRAENENGLMLENLQFVDHSSPNTKTLENFFLLCGQIVGETFEAVKISSRSEYATVKILLANDLKEYDETFKKHMLPLFKALHQEISQSQIQVKYVSKNDVTKARKNSDKHAGYLLISKNIQGYLAEITSIAESNGNVFFLSLEGNPKIPESFVKITAEKIDKFDLSLYKKKVITAGTNLKITPDTANWLPELKNELCKISAQSQVFLQWSSKSICEIANTINSISAIRPQPAIRYFVIMNENSEVPSKYAPNSLTYKQEAQKGLITNIYKNGKWGSIRNLIPVDQYSRAFLASAIIEQINSIEGINISYVTRVTDKEIQSNSNIFEFSGVTTDRRKVMGINYSYPSIPTKTNTFLSLPVPDQWSLEDAVTVPLPYTKAYFAIIKTVKLKANSTILVYHGHSVLGEASISIALSLNCTVFATVANSLQGKYLKERFRHSSHLIIINTQIQQADIEILKATKKVGIDVAINPQNEREVQQSLQILKYYGKLLVLEDTDLRSGLQFGMEAFGRSVTMYSILTQELFKCDDNFKSTAQKWLLESMKCGIIKPFKQILVNPDEMKNSVNSDSDEYVRRTVARLDSASIVKQNKFRCHREKLYLVAGNRDETWLTVISWLIENNAKKIALVDCGSSSNYNDEYTKRFSCYIEGRSDLSFVYLSASMLLGKQNTAQMIRNLNLSAELDTVFCISLNSTLCSNLDYGVRRETKHLRQFICLQCDASEICESRIQSGLPALQVIWDASIRNMVALTESLSQTIDNSLQRNSSCLFIFQMSHFKEKFEYSTINVDSEFLPEFSEAEQFIGSFSTQASFEKVVSKCSYYCTRTQLFPIFILPSLHSQRLKPLIKNLMYPVFCARYPIEYMSAKWVAERLIKPLKKIQPKGPYTIVGESWSGVIAIELVSLLEKEDPSTNINLILLEGLPKNIQHRLSSIGSFGDAKFLNELKEICFKEEYKSESKEKLLADKSEGKFIELLQKKLATVKEYSSEKAFLRSKVFAVNLADKSVLETFIDFEKYYGANLELKNLDEHEFNKLLSSEVTSNIINENVLFTW